LRRRYGWPRRQAGRIIAREADVRDSAALSAAVADGVAEFGHLDCVVANAGVLSSGLAHEQSEEQYQTMIDINLAGVWRTAKAAIPTLIAQGTGGSMVLTSSVMGLRAASGMIGYVAAKYGVVGMMKALAHELAPHRVRVNTVHPTNANTPMIINDVMAASMRPDLKNPTMDDTRDILAAYNLINEPWVEPEDVSNAVLWLLSDEARTVTGVTLPVDLGAATK
jgi:(+)-trans-carveol dehydrogenase